MMLEITGNCPGECAICLPREERSGRDMTVPEVISLGLQAKRLGVTQVMLAGYGNPATHPEFDLITHWLASKLKLTVAVVCRPRHLPLVSCADVALVSVETPEDAGAIARAEIPMLSPVNAHIILSDRTAARINETLRTLASIPRLGLVNIMTAVKLCEDPRHIQAVREANANLPANVQALHEAIARLPEASRVKFQWVGDHPYWNHCPFALGAMIYVDSNLVLRPCCHLPMGGSLGNLRETVLAVALEQSWGAWVAGTKTWAPCMRCPDGG